MIPEWAQDVQLDELKGGAREIAEVIGVMPALRLMEQYGGGSGTYIPKLEDTLVEARNRRIRKEYNGYNTRKLAWRYRLTERRIQQIVSGKLDEIDGQTDLFGML